MKPQFIRTEQGEELVVLPRRDYDALVGKTPLNEDIATARIVAKGKAALAAGHELALPSSVAEAIVRGSNEIRVVREWRGLTQADLAREAGLTQGYISQLEGGSSAGTPKALRSIARALRVPLDLIVAG